MIHVQKQANVILPTDAPKGSIIIQFYLLAEPVAQLIAQEDAQHMVSGCVIVVMLVMVLQQ